MDTTRYGSLFVLSPLLAVATCTGGGDGESRAEHGAQGADASRNEDARVEVLEAGFPISDGGSTRSDAAVSRACPSAVPDAGGMQCMPDTWPLAITKDGRGNCTATLPANIDTTRLTIESGFTSAPQWGTTTLRRIDAPCADLAGTPDGVGWYLDSESTIEICMVCSPNYDVAFWAVIPCEETLDASAGCIPEVVTVEMRLEEGRCFLDLLPEADWCVPLGFTFGVSVVMDGEVPYMPSLPCDDPANHGWQPVDERTLRLCAGTCVQPPLYTGAEFDVTLECNPTRD